MLDGDTNDTRDPLVENDTRPGQTLPIPATVGGYASLAVTERGKADEFDIYRVNIPGAMKIALSIAEPDDGDLDLLFADVDGEIIRQSVGTGRFEVIETEADEVGEFYIAVAAYDGASNYILSVGVATASDASLAALRSDSDHLSLDAEFVADEVLVKAAKNSGQKQHKSMLASLATTYGLVEKASSPSGVMLMRLQDVEKSTFMQQAKVSARQSPFHYPSKAAQAKAQQLGIIKKLRRNPAVEYAEPNYISHTTATPNDDFFDFQWHYAAINLPQAWDITTGSEDVVVAVIDTGVVIHPDLSSNLLYDGNGDLVGFDFISDAETAGDGDGIDADPIDIGDSAGGGNSSFHGTHVAGTIAATTNNATGVAGVGWNSRIMPIRTVGACGGTSYDVAQGLRYAAGLANDSGSLPPVKANIANLSLGPANGACESLPLSETTRESMQDAQDAGVIVIVSAGNDDYDVPSLRSTVDGVINVSAVDIQAKSRVFQ